MKYIAIVTILLFTASLSSMDSVRQLWLPSGQPELVDVKTILTEIGSKYDCYFTIEEALISGNINNSLERQKIAVKLNKSSLKDELEQLLRLVPHFAYEIKNSDPKVIHVSDNRLVAKQGYPMSTTIANISFDGSLVDFIDTIAQTGVPISPRGLVDIHENMSVDRYTRVKVEERGQRVRDLITNSIDLRTRPRVVWIARTELGAKSTTFIQYLRKASR